jgi:hypothetical protein
MYSRSGGLLTAKFDYEEWELTFGGSSGDYGVFTPYLMVRQGELVKALKMSISFEYSGRCKFG